MILGIANLSLNALSATGGLLLWYGQNRPTSGLIRDPCGSRLGLSVGLIENIGHYGVFRMMGDRGHVSVAEKFAKSYMREIAGSVIG